MIESSLFSDLLLLTDSSLQVVTTDRSSLAYKLFDPVGIPGTDAAPPVDHSKVNGTCHHRLVEELQHLAGYTEGSKPSQENVCPSPSCTPS